MSHPFLSQELAFYLTPPAPCPYMPGREERKAFTPLNLGTNNPEAVHHLLARNGFRRSQMVSYRPACPNCSACVSVRIPVKDFVYNKRWRRVLARNRDLQRDPARARATQERFALFKTYVGQRHADGGMAAMSFSDFRAMIEATPILTVMIDYYQPREDGDERLIASALTDVLGDGLSLVYSFFDPHAQDRSLGSYVILDHIAIAAQAGLDYVYLGYWVAGSEKMAYKRDFTPLEALVGAEWVRYDPE